MENHDYRGQCGACRRMVEAYNRTIDTGVVHQIGLNKDISPTDPEEQTHIVSYSDFETICTFAKDGQHVGPYSDKSVVCEKQ